MSAALNRRADGGFVMKAGWSVGRQIIGIPWEEMEGRALPVLLLNGWDRDGNAATATILCDPEGNGSGHVEHWL